MEVTSTTPTNSQTAGSVGSSESSKNAINSDFETFIKMLTTQMQNQDPLNPIESADFAVQLATFSTVEQQAKTNSLLTSLADRISGMGVAQLSGWVGMTARAVVPVVFDGSPVSLSVHTAPQADRAELVVRNGAGDVVNRHTIPAESGDFEWNGLDGSGAPLLSGSYSLSVESFDGDEVVQTSPVEVNGRIVEARNDGGQTVLVMDGGQEISADDILGLRESD